MRKKGSLKVTSPYGTLQKPSVSHNYGLLTTTLFVPLKRNASKYKAKWPK
jgi:hypothetical protein